MKTQIVLKFLGKKKKKKSRYSFVDDDIKSDLNWLLRNKQNQLLREKTNCL